MTLGQLAQSLLLALALIIVSIAWDEAEASGWTELEMGMGIGVRPFDNSYEQENTIGKDPLGTLYISAHYTHAYKLKLFNYEFPLSSIVEYEHISSMPEKDNNWGMNMFWYKLQITIPLK